MSDSDGSQIASRKVLVLAYYFPPMGLSGVQRTAKFVKYLPKYGWEPTVLTSHPRGYFAYDETLMEEVDAANVAVHRTASWDPTRLFGRRAVVSFPGESARRTLSLISQLFLLPDNKVGWWRPARKKALELISRHEFDVIYSSAPPYTSHLVGAGLASSTGIPLVIDFRDDWVGNPRHTYPTSLHQGISAHFERRALGAADRTIVINDVIRRNLFSRNPDVTVPEDIVVIPHGFDAQDFEIEPSIPGLASDSDTFTMLYSGVFYDAQTPEPFLRALSDVITRRVDLRQRIRAVFVGLLSDKTKDLANELGLSDVIHHTGYLPHPQTVACVKAADALWMTIGRTEGAESVTTSKLYEYFGSRKPVLGLVPVGAARDALTRYGAAEIVDPEAVSEISAGIEHLYELWLEGVLPEPAADFVEQFERSRLTARLARLFDGVVRHHAPSLDEAGPTST